MTFIEENAERPSKRSGFEHEDYLDAAFAMELFGKLSKIVERSGALDEMVLNIASEDVKRYFEETHRCYLFGFPIASAVLCRALHRVRDGC